uniref:Uncharacterized protein n=1 Tax=Kalanchoe fedtschenkoi TaxID=63787 RepID=A0A7N0U7N2_KALFE
MEVLIGPTARDDRGATWRDARFGSLGRDTDASTDARNLGLGFGFASRGSGRSEEDKSVSPLSSSSSSSIGEQSDDDGEVGEEVQSQARSALSSLESLEDSLPVKRGLSNHFEGKSKSFTNLSAVGSVEDLKKVENPINKRRRTLMASKWARKAGKASFYGWSSHPTSMPLLALPEDDDEEEEEDQGAESPSPRDRETRRMRSFKSPSCFCLTDLQEEDDEEEDDL